MYFLNISQGIKTLSTECHRRGKARIIHVIGEGPCNWFENVFALARFTPAIKYEAPFLISFFFTMWCLAFILAFSDIKN